MLSSVFFVIFLYCCSTRGTNGLLGVCPGWTYRSDFDSCYLLLNETNTGKMTWKDARTACQSAANASNQNILTSDGQSISKSSDADLLTISHGSDEEAFVYSNLWKKGGSTIGWIGGTFSNVSLLPSLEYSAFTYDGECNKTLGFNESNSVTATYGTILYSVSASKAIGGIDCYWAIVAPIGTTAQYWIVDVDSIYAIDDSGGYLALLNDTNAINQKFASSTNWTGYRLAATRLALHFHLSINNPSGGFFSISFKAVLSPKFGMKAVWLNGSWIDSWNYKYLTGYKDAQLATFVLLLKILGSVGCFAGIASTTNYYYISPYRCDSKFALAYCRMPAPQCSAAPNMAYTYVSGSTYYSKYLNYTCFPGTLFADGNSTNLLRCVYRVVNESFTQFYWKSSTGSVSNCSIQQCAPPADLSLPNVTFNSLYYSNMWDYEYPSMCAPNADGSGTSPLSAYCVNTSIYYTCPNGNQRSSSCVWNSTSKTAYWSSTGNCFAVCPSPAPNYQQLTFYYSAATGKCYSDPIGSQITPFWPYWLYTEYQSNNPYYTCNYGYGSQVLSIESAVEQNFVMSTVFSSMANLSRDVWLDAYYDGDSIYWIDDGTISTTLLYNNFPPEFDVTIVSAGLCLYMNTTSGFWNLQDCLQNAYYSCEYTPSSCDTIPHVNYTNVSTTSTSWQTLVVYTCQPGYQVYRSNGSQSTGVITQNISCEFQNSSGLLYWKGAEALRSCVPLNCNPPTTPQNASLNSTIYAAPPNNWNDTSVMINGLYFAGSIIQYKCAPSNVFNNSFNNQLNMTCSNIVSYRADWYPSNPQCIPISCADYPIVQPSYSTISISPKSSNNGLDTVLTYTCNANYFFNDETTSKSYKCVLDGATGKWNPQQSDGWEGCLATNPQHDVLAYLTAQLKLNNYSRAIRPRVNFADNLTLELKFVLNYITELDSNGHFTTLGNILARWKDDYLVWSEMNNSEFYTSELAEISASTIWQPQPSLYNTITGGARLDFSNRTVKVAQDGTVLAQLFMEINSICEMEVYAFPFDTQTCELIFQFDVYSASEVRFKKIKQNVTAQYKPNNYWFLVQEKDGITEVNVTVLSTTDLQTQLKSVYTYSATLNRNPSNAVYTVIVPLVILSFFSIFTYIVPQDGETRMNILTAVFLAFIFLQSVIQTVVPQENNPPAISNYILVSMILASINIIFSTILLWIKNFFRGLPTFLTADRLRRWRNLKFFTKQSNFDSKNRENFQEIFSFQLRSALNNTNLKSMMNSTYSQLSENYTSTATNATSIANMLQSHIEMQYIASRGENQQERLQHQNPSQYEDLKLAYKRYVALTALQQEEAAQKEMVPENILELTHLLNRVVGFILMLVNLGWGLYTALILSGVVKTVKTG